VEMEDLIGVGDQWHLTSFATEEQHFLQIYGSTSTTIYILEWQFSSWADSILHSTIYTMLVKFHTWTYEMRSCYYFTCYYTKAICFVFGIDVYRTNISVQECHSGLADSIKITCQIYFTLWNYLRGG
jgi:hypothetical protein